MQAPLPLGMSLPKGTGSVQRQADEGDAEEEEAEEEATGTAKGK